jgi:ABC-type polysaccharide/polyol phosphate transport system ATPase subunit
VPLALRAHSLWKSYAVGVAGCSARIWVLRGATLELYDGERVAILGARGAGTTTLLHCLAGFRRLDAGTIEHRRPPLLLAVAHGSSTQQSPRQDDVVLVDEITPQGTATLVSRVVREPVECGAAMIIATRSLSSVRHCVDRVLLLRDGHLTDVPLRSGSRRVAECSATSDTRARARPGTARA